jgi:hypothetical protein
VVEVPATSTPEVVNLLARDHASASFAISHDLSPRLKRLLAAHHDQTISQLGRPGIDDWLGTVDAVDDTKSRRFVLAPRGGVSTGQYVLARLSGAHLVAPARHLRRGAIILWGSGSLPRLLTSIAARGLQPVPVAALTQANR